MLDACTTGQNPLNFPFFYTLDQDNDGLKLNWFRWTFCNPPYSQVSLWVEKAFNENKHRGIGIIMLLPSRTDTKWFHEFIYTNPRCEVRFLKGRLKFKGTKNSAPFPSMVVIFR